LSVLLKYGAGEAFSLGNGRDFSQPGGAHQPNEFMICDSLVEFAKVIAAYVLRLVG
jgi:acetylornithine deacetylase/succinyl-diaminopimelate desuccinylase-like protein